MRAKKIDRPRRLFNAAKCITAIAILALLSWSCLAAPLISRALYVATREQDYASMEQDIRLGADVNFKSNGMISTLQAAVANGDARATAILLRHGANVHLLDRISLTHLSTPEFRRELAKQNVVIPEWAVAYKHEQSCLPPKRKATSNQ